MVLYPKAQKRAQEEMDSVLGHGHLPVFGDEDALPYLKAMLYEVIRWNPGAPLGFPHRLTENDVYNGYFIPAGSIVFSNSWAILHDPATYPEPSKFTPERFLDPARRAPFPEAAFGFGRRRCPGAYLVESSVWLMLATMLAMLDIEKPRDKNGRDMEPDVKFENSVFRTSTRFAVLLRPRSDAVLKLIDEEL